MKKYLLGAAAMLAVAAPGVALADTSGYVGLNYSNIDTDGLGNTDTYGAHGSVAFQATDTLGLEVDGAIGDGDDTGTALGLTGHLFMRDDQYLFGGFVGIADSDDTDTTWDAGLEANKYFNSWTLAGSLAYASNDDADVDAWGATVQGRFFPMDNLRLQAQVGWNNVDYGAGGDDTGVSLGVGAEYQLSQVPISFGANYDHIEFDDSGVDADAWTLAVRYNFGAGTLKDRDRHGASQADISGVSSALGL
jgi:Outer membrane protein beta-barrel domain